jgi:hypothetical protein
VHTLSHILCVALRWARSCTGYVTLGCNSEPRGVTVTRTYIHLAIGSAFKQAAHIAAEPLPGGRSELTRTHFRDRYQVETARIHKSGGWEHQGGEMNCKTRTWLMISEKMNGD